MSLLAVYPRLIGEKIHADVRVCTILTAGEQIPRKQVHTISSHNWVYKQLNQMNFTITKNTFKQYLIILLCWMQNQNIHSRKLLFSFILPAAEKDVMLILLNQAACLSMTTSMFMYNVVTEIIVLGFNCVQIPSQCWPIAQASYSTHLSERGVKDRKRQESGKRDLKEEIKIVALSAETRRT